MTKIQKLEQRVAFLEILNKEITARATSKYSQAFKERINDGLALLFRPSPNVEEVILILKEMQGFLQSIPTQLNAR